MPSDPTDDTASYSHGYTDGWLAHGHKDWRDATPEEWDAATEQFRKRPEQPVDVHVTIDAMTWFRKKLTDEEGAMPSDPLPLSPDEEASLRAWWERDDSLVDQYPDSYPITRDFRRLLATLDEARKGEQEARTLAIASERERVRKAVANEPPPDLSLYEYRARIIPRHDEQYIERSRVLALLEDPS